MNPLISMMAQQANGQMPGIDMIRRFGEFRRNWTPDAARAKIDEMLRSGQISMQQYEQARQMAQQFGNILR